MAQPSDVWNELLAIKAELTDVVNAKAEETRTTARAHAEAVAEQVQNALKDIADAFREEEQRFEAIFAARPLPALALAFALGLVVGVSTRALR